MSNSKETPFVWDDQSVEDYFKFFVLYNKKSILDGMSHEEAIMEFKASRSTPKPKTLFTTEDGKPVNEGDRVWFVDSLFKIGFHDFAGCETKHYPDIYKYFGTEETAKEYIVNHRQILSFQDVIDVLYYADDKCKAAEELKQLVQSKINGK